MAKYYAHSLATSTSKSYSYAQSRYLTFCNSINVSPLPLSKHLVCLFVTHLADTDVSHQSIKCYLSALRHLQISSGLSDPKLYSSCPKLGYVLKGIKRIQSPAATPNQRLPITPTILRCLKEVWEKESHSRRHDVSMLWAACCLGFFAFMRAGEFTVPSDHEYNASIHLSYSDVTVDKRSDPQMICVRIKHSITDQFNEGVSIYLG